MNDDLNTAVALSVMFDLVRLSNKAIDDKKLTRETLGAVNDMFTKLGGDVLGIVPEEYAEAGGIDEKAMDKLLGSSSSSGRRLARRRTSPGPTQFEPSSTRSASCWRIPPGHTVEMEMIALMIVDG